MAYTQFFCLYRTVYDKKNSILFDNFDNMKEKMILVQY